MVLSFGDLCKLLEGAERISTRRPRYTPEKEQENIKQHVADWFKKHRECLGNLLQCTAWKSLLINPQITLRRQVQPYSQPYFPTEEKTGCTACSHHCCPRKSLS